jgi:peptidoglycan hydrolase-like protein with peptidoglycan-binding domain
MKWHGFCGGYDGCRQTNAPEIDDSSAYKLSAPVGAPPRSRNLSGDVYEVQRALNRFSPADGGPNPPLAIDGICGPKTIAAIRSFQLKKFGWSGADGVVDPGQQTERALFGGSGQNAYGPWGSTDPTQPTSSATPAAEMYANVARALTIINITRSQIASARNFRFGGSTLGFGEGAWNKLVKHFQIDKFRSWEKALTDIDRVYSDMQTAIGYQPQGVVLFVDQSPNSTRGAYAWAVSGGYDISRRSVDADEGWPAGSILVMRKMRTLKSDAYAYVLIHELAHYVGPINPDITDFAYHTNPTNYAALRPEQRVRNADCYAQFAFDAIGKPFKHSEHEL